MRWPISSTYGLSLFLLSVAAPDAAADLVRIELTGTHGPFSTLPQGTAVSGFVVYDTRSTRTAYEQGNDFASARFDGAITAFSLAGVGGSSDNFVGVRNNSSAQTFEFVDEGAGLTLSFRGSGSVDLGSSTWDLPVAFPDFSAAAASWRAGPAGSGSANGMLTSFAVSVVPRPGGPRAWWVGNDGVDSPDCGDGDRKCRSISQALRHASYGDTIVVEVGVYGDLNGNGVIGEPGEESGHPTCTCLVFVNNRVTILSERGAAATVIDARATNLDTVELTTPGTAFGYVDQGFTLLAGALPRFGGETRGIVSQSSGLVTVYGNRAVGGGSGVVTRHGDVGYNEVTGAGGPFGFAVNVTRGRVSRNVVARNAAGGVSVGDASVEDNIIVGNAGAASAGSPESAAALLLRGDSARVSGNDIVGNLGTGIFVAPDRSNGVKDKDIVIQDNNIIGNDRGTLPGQGTRCGLRNETGGYLWAAENYWGTQGEADLVCNGPGSITVMDPMRQQPDSRQ